MRRPSFARIAGLVGATLVVGVIGYLSVGPKKRPGVSEQLSNIAQARRDTVIDLGEVARFEWTDVYIFPPYTSEAMAEKRMGVAWRGPWGAIKIRDTLSLLVFVDSLRITGVVEHPRTMGDFVTISDVQRFRRSDARFALVRSGSTGPVFQPISVRTSGDSSDPR